MDTQGTFYTWQEVIGLTWQFVFSLVHLAPSASIDVSVKASIHMH